jgi:hexosaminidase
MSIIPLPAQIETKTGFFHFKSQTCILADSPNQWNAGYLQKLLSIPIGIPFHYHSEVSATENLIQLHLDPSLSSLGAEGYRLEITVSAVKIEALETAGIFYGIQSLRQLLPASVESDHLVENVDWSIPCQVIIDRPRFSWRGFMLDEGRHFQGIQTILQTLDLMALQKLNIFHWHLTDDQGWRIEIKKYPRLTGVGSTRPGTSKSILGKKHDGRPHGGFYTQEQICEVVSFAAERHITVVPEIEIPGHCTAALAAYPEYSCTGGPFEVATHFGIYPDIYCPGNEATISFLQDVLNEILDLFPSRYIHIGGDEAPKIRWKKCPRCQERIRLEGLKDEDALQVYFTNRILVYLASKGRYGIGWNEILHEGLIEGALAQYWVGNRKELLEALNSGKHRVIMSSYLDTYLDHGYNLTPLSRAYQYEPVPAGINEQAAGSVIGIEPPLWTEWVPTKARFDYQVFPRLAVLSESAWTPKECKDLADFRLRLDKFMLRLDCLGIQHAPLEAVEPSFLKRLFGIFTIALPQQKTMQRG